MWSQHQAPWCTIDTLPILNKYGEWWRPELTDHNKIPIKRQREKILMTPLLRLLYLLRCTPPPDLSSPLSSPLSLFLLHLSVLVDSCWLPEQPACDELWLRVLLVWDAGLLWQVLPLPRSAPSPPRCRVCGDWPIPWWRGCQRLSAACYLTGAGKGWGIWCITRTSQINQTPDYPSIKLCMLNIRIKKYSWWITTSALFSRLSGTWWSRKNQKLVRKKKEARENEVNEEKKKLGEKTMGR